MENEILKSIVTYFGAGGVLLAFVAAAGKGILAWKSERTAQTPNEIHNSQLETFRLIAHEANTRADTFAAERNELLVKVTRVEGELARLSDVVEQNARLREVNDHKDAEIRRMLTDHTETVRKMLEIIHSKDTIMLAQAERISTLEEAMRNLKEQIARQSPSPGTTVTTVTTER
jgi:hypothetical protein